MSTEHMHVTSSRVFDNHSDFLKAAEKKRKRKKKKTRVFAYNIMSASSEWN